MKLSLLKIPLPLVCLLGLASTADPACNSHRLATPQLAPITLDEQSFTQSINRKLDLLFMVDDSPSMAPLQAKMSQQLGNFMDALADPATGRLPDLHVAVVSSSFGGGKWGNVNQCGADSHPGDDGGKFQQGPGGAGSGSCAMLHQGQTFLKSGNGTDTPNYDGDIRDAFKCMALLGDSGCGFESQFESVYYALYKASKPDDPDNGGFLREEAELAIVMVTNEDDCSVAANSLLLDPGINSVTDPTGLGALQSYRCNEFGHLCHGAPPPHDAPSGSVTLDGCVSAEDMGKTDPDVRAPDGSSDPTMGHLWPTVADFSDFLRSLKDPDNLLVAAIAGPRTSDSGQSLYRVLPQANPSAGGEIDPVVDHSCTHAASDSSMPEYADPAVRIGQWIDGFGANGVFYPICADDFRRAMVGIATSITNVLKNACVSDNIAPLDVGDATKGHDCKVGVPGAGGARQPIPECAPLAGAPTNAPCYRLTTNAPACAAADNGKTTLLTICPDSTCTPGDDALDADISCLLL
ncbi:MAG TPA: hypothetical protein VGP07_05375 [Polyangia bacterium]